MLGGTNFARPAAIEVDCAEALLELVPRADMVKFCKDGSTANTAADHARARLTGRDLVAICADDPFLSYNDWFIGTTPMDAGIPRPSGADAHVPLQRPRERRGAVLERIRERSPAWSSKQSEPNLLPTATSTA